MAPKVKAPKEKKPKAPKTPKAPRKETRENPGQGHNIEALKEMGGEIVERFLNLSKDMASDMAGYRSDFNTLYDEAANSLGLKKSVLSRELKRILKNKLAEEKEREIASDEREQTILFREIMDGTPFGQWAAGQLAEAAVSE